MRGNYRHSTVRAAGLASAAIAALLSTPASAQDAEPAGTASTTVTEEGGLEDIVVTAERRATNLQDTPISIVAVTEEAVQAKGIEDLQDLSTFTPNLSISATRGNGNNSANFVIRGIAGGGGATGERGVGLYIDGIYMPRTSGAVLRVLDIDRIEVLRGPQGTLFGRNSTGGAIRIFSKQPSQEQEGYLRLTVGNFDRTDIVGMINLPLGDTFAVRAQAAYLDEDGYVSRGTEMLGATEDFIARVQGRWEPTPDFTATLGFLYSDSKANGTPLVFREFDMRPGIEGVIQGNFADWLNDSFKLAGQAPLQAYNDPRLVRGPFSAPDICLIDDFHPDYDAVCNQYNDNKYVQTDLSVEYDLNDDISLSSITGYAKLEHRGFSDYQVLGTEIRNDDVDSTVFYQEVQLNAALFDDAIDLVVGGNYFHEKSEAPNFTLNRRGTSVFPSNPGTPPNADAGLFRLTDVITKQISDSYGLFVSATWHVTDRLNLTGGLRQAWDEKDYMQTRFRTDLAGGRTTLTTPTDFTPAPGTISTTVQSDKTFKALDYRATVDYHFTDDIMAYGTISKAYKAGQFSYTIVSWTPANNATGENQSAGIQPIPNEKVINYEIGARMTLFDGRLRINPTLFHMDYTNRQAAVQVTCGTGALAGIPPGPPQCPVGFLILVQNQGDVELEGIEVDAQLAVTDNFILDGSLGVTDPKLKNAPAGTVNLFPDVPSPTYNFGATWTIEEPIGKATLNLNYAYVGKQETHPTRGTDSAYTLPSYGLVNARIQFVPNDLPVTLTVFANNLLDNTYATYAQRFGGGFWDSGAGTGLAAPLRNALAEVRGRPREVGITMQYNF